MFDIIKVACLLLSALAPPLPAAPPLAGDGEPSTSCAFVELEFFAFFGSGSTPTRKAASEYANAQSSVGISGVTGPSILWGMFG